nr:hypothetical protein KitaXyl93_24910 [Kitasatospora sp. Xyl93]
MQVSLAEPCQYRTARSGVSTADGTGRRVRTARAGAGNGGCGRTPGGRVAPGHGGGPDPADGPFPGLGYP